MTNLISHAEKICNAFFDTSAIHTFALHSEPIRNLLHRLHDPERGREAENKAAEEDE